MQWVYKATDLKLDHAGTMMLADRKGFLCRSAYEEKTRTWADNVRDVSPGDTIHFYYSKNGKVSPIGSFEVVVPGDDHPTKTAFGEQVPGSALYVVADPTFIKRLDTHGAYKEDPVLGKFTGWALRTAGKAPPYHPRMFKNMTTLQKYGGDAKSRGSL